MWQDLKLALRGIRARPGFALVVLATLALGIGANTAIFTVVDTAVLRPLPYQDPEQLYFIFPTNPKDAGKDRLARLAEVQVLRRQLHSFSDLAVATRIWEMALPGDAGEAKPIKSIFASANLFDTLGVKPALGRKFLPEEDVVGGPAAVVLTHAAWLRRFGGDPAVVGRNIQFRGARMPIVGVLPANVNFPDPSCEIWLPLSQSAGAQKWRLLTVVGRLRPGVSEGQARAELPAGARALASEFPEANTGIGLRLVSVHRELTSEARPTLLVLFAAVGLVLLVACANVANLMLARGLSRGGELAVRAALGASRGRLMRQLLTEGLLLALAGGALGALLAHWGVAFALRHSPIPVPTHHPVSIDGKVLAFTLALSLSTGLLFSLVPAWRLLRVDPQQALRAQGRGATGSRGHRRVSSSLVVAEMAMALLLLIGAGLLLRTVGHLLAVDPGFTAPRLLSMRLHAPPGITPDRWLPLNRQIEDQLRALPGVEAVGQISRVPFGALPNVLQGFEIEDQPVAPAQRPSIDVRYATTDYFRAMGIPLRRGRLVVEQDRALAVVNEAAARRFWPGQDPLGKRVRSAGSADPFTEWHTVVGIVGNVRHASLEEAARPELYYYAGIDQRASLVVRANADPARLVPAVRAAILQVDRRAAISSVETMDGLVMRSMATRRFGMRLLGAFAGLAMLLASLGLYGVMAYAIAQRRQEIGVRMALGAQARDVSMMVVREGMALVLAGAAIGLTAALALGRLMSGLLHGVTAWDPLTLTVVPALLAAVALLTAYLAARRAARIEPMIALRQG